jgi:NADH-quinone oxidoreductase subunit G
VILPGAAYTEKPGTYVNTEGRVQQTLRAVFPPGDAREDWTIIRALSEVAGHVLPFNNLDELGAAMIKAVPHFAAVDSITPASWGKFGTSGEPGKAPLTYAIDNFYMTNPICRASRVMAECSAAMSDEERATGTHG